MSAHLLSLPVSIAIRNFHYQNLMIILRYVKAKKRIKKKSKKKKRRNMKTMTLMKLKISDLKSTRAILNTLTHRTMAFHQKYTIVRKRKRKRMSMKVSQKFLKWLNVKYAILSLKNLKLTTTSLLTICKMKILLMIPMYNKIKLKYKT